MAVKRPFTSAYSKVEAVSSRIHVSVCLWKVLRIYRVLHTGKAEDSAPVILPPNLMSWSPRIAVLRDINLREISLDVEGVPGRGNPGTALYSLLDTLHQNSKRLIDEQQPSRSIQR